MLLNEKTAVIYGAGGSMGTRVAAAFAREGAKLFLVGRSADSVRAGIADLGLALESVDVAEVDATDEATVQKHLAEVVARTGRIDISFNLISVQDVQGKPLVEMELGDYLRPVEIGTRSHFLTATAAARLMSARGRGVIMALVATPARLALPLVGGFGTYCGAIEGMYRTLAAECGEHGVRVAWLRSAGSPETFAPREAVDAHGERAGLGADEYLESMRTATLLKRFPRADEIADFAAVIASDRASAMTGAGANLTCGQIVD